MKVIVISIVLSKIDGSGNGSQNIYWMDASLIV